MHPTVALMRRERAQLHHEMESWVKRFKKSRDEFLVIEQRMLFWMTMNKV
jgi:hypothetical protein